MAELFQLVFVEVFKSVELCVDLIFDLLDCTQDVLFYCLLDHAIHVDDDCKLSWTSTSGKISNQTCWLKAV